MYINRHLRKCIQNGSSQFHIDLHGIERIILPGTSGRNLKALMPIRINRANIVHDCFLQLLEPFILHVNHRADAGYPKNLLQMYYGFFIIEIRNRIHIDASIRPANGKFPFTSLQSVFNLLYQCILKQIPVLSFHTDLGIFYQKSCKHISS